MKASGLRWVCVMVLVEIPWASRVWAFLPFLCALAPSERYAAQRGRRHKKPTDYWAWQLLLLLRRWYPEREIIAVADSTYASLKLLFRCRSLSKPVTFITRLRLVDAALYEPAPPPRRPGQIGRPRLEGERLPNLSVVAEDPSISWKSARIANWYGNGERMVELASNTAVWYSTGLFAVPLRWVPIRDPQKQSKTRALLCTDLEADPQKILSWFVMRWQLEVTFQEVQPASRVRDAKAVVGFGGTASHTDAVGSVLAGHFVCASPVDRSRSGCFSASGVVPQDSSDLCRCARLGAQRVVGAGDFLRVVPADRHGKSPAGVCRTTNRGGLLCGLMAKVELF